MKPLLYTLCLCASFFISIDNIYSQVIPNDRTVDWTVAGLDRPLPHYGNVVNIMNFGGSNNGLLPNDIALQAAILSLGGDSGVIYFPAGAYQFLTTIQLRSGLIIRGEDAASTTLEFNLNGLDDLIKISGNTTNTKANATSSAAKGSDSISVDNSSGFNVDDYVKLTQNDSSLVFDDFRSVGQILRIKTINGNTITFHHNFRRAFNVADQINIQLLSMVQGSGIECTKIKRLDATTTQKTNIVFSYAANCWVKGIESDSANFAHIILANSTNVEITGSYFHGAFGFGPGGRGYGISTQMTTGECLVENNVFRRLRHAMIVQSGANGNVYSHNYSREPFKSEQAPFDLAGDIVLHGNYPYANLFESNVVQNIVIDASHKINGPFNTFFRNRAELYGILMSTGSGDSTNMVGNEVTNTAINFGNYIMRGNGNFEYGNNVRGFITPVGTTSLPDNSYYYSSEPYFWQLSSPWPSIGIPNTINTRSIPAAMRWLSGNHPSVCSSGTLPVRVLEISGDKQEGKNIIKWTTNNSVEVQNFEVEKSADAGLFKKFATVLAVYNPADIWYEAADYSPHKTQTYYRVKMILKTGRSVYSKVIKIVTHTNSETFNVYPNPAINKIRISSNKSPLNIQIRNNSGQVILQHKTAESSTTIDVSSLAKGIYYVECLDENGKERMSRKVVKQ